MDNVGQFYYIQYRIYQNPTKNSRFFDTKCESVDANRQINFHLTTFKKILRMPVQGRMATVFKTGLKLDVKQAVFLLLYKYQEKP